MIFQLIDESQIVFLNESTRDNVIDEMIDIFYQLNIIEDKKFLKEAISKREQLESTGIGMGVALPHTKINSFNNFYIALGISRAGIDWPSLDDAPVKIVFMILGPENKPSDYLKLLSQITSFIKNDEVRKKILYSQTCKEIIELFKQT